ncbi:MAG TPA: ABC transporter substrate-binding protein [Candidatus Limnocylindrales bacterium]|nr:ABC transporter substrate-binding protein [Candidatus Limnocylindrales bacterium]
MRMFRTLALGAALLVLAGACSLGGGSKPSVRIGSVGFDEAKVIAEIYAQVLEKNGYTVERKFGLGERPVVAPALESGQFDLQPEYIGSRLVYEGGSPSGDSAATFADLQERLLAKNLTALNYTPGVDTNAFVVRAETAQELGLATLSDAAAVQDQLEWGLAADCPTNALCGAPGGALAQYGITAETIAAGTLLASCSTPMADALKAGTIDVAELCSTQPDILVNGWVLLEDDLHTQPAENVAPIVRNDFLAKVGDRAAFDKIFNDVSAQIDTATMTDLYKQVAVDLKDVGEVAETWLRAEGFVE